MTTLRRPSRPALAARGAGACALARTTLPAALAALAFITTTHAMTTSPMSPTTTEPQKGGDRWVSAGTKVGQALPDLAVADLDGKKQPLAKLWSKRPVLLVTASLTCPVARGTCARLDSVRTELGDSADLVILYTTEAHPKGSASPYRPDSGEWLTKENERDGILRPQPTTLDERLALARELRTTIGDESTIVVDLLDDAAWTALGGGPNMAVLVDTTGAVRFKQGWIDPKSVGEAVKDALPPKPPKPSADAGKRVYSAAGFDITKLSREQVAELAKALSPEAYKVTQRSGTEPAGSCGTLLDNKKDGTYVCVVCGLPLFASTHKFNSGTGWPSFHTTFDPKHVSYKVDGSHGMQRVEINCARCESHLGHVFEDGPKETTGLRYCLNGVALNFLDKNEPVPAASQPAVKTAVAYFAGGCFWGVEHIFAQCPGVLDAESGYMNGRTDNPTYEEVCNHKSGHAEAVKVVYDPTKVSYRQLLEGFFMMHDPTQLNRQGPDVGDQYRSAVFTTNDAELAEAKAFAASLSATPAFAGKKIVTVIEPAKKFYSAERYHQDYVERTGRVCHVSNPWSKIFGAATP